MPLSSDERYTAIDDVLFRFLLRYGRSWSAERIHEFVVAARAIHDLTKPR